VSVDPDLPAPGPHPSPLLAAAVVGGGGAVGALARAGIAELWPHRLDEWPWATVVTNATGSALLGVLLVVLAARYPRDRFARPLLGTGVLGGYTTFSTFSVDAAQLVRSDHPGVALGYVVATVAAILLGALLGLVLARRFLGAEGSQR
jgi:CrcB protein